MGSFSYANFNNKPTLPQLLGLGARSLDTWARVHERFKDKQGENLQITLEKLDKPLPKGAAASLGANTLHIRVGNDLRGIVSHGLHNDTLRFDISLHQQVRQIGLYHACLEHVINAYVNEGHDVKRIPALVNSQSSQTCREFFRALANKCCVEKQIPLSELMKDVQNNAVKALALRGHIIDAAQSLSITHVRRQCGFGTLSSITVIPDPFDESDPKHTLYLEFFRGEPLDISQISVKILTQDDSLSSHQKVSLFGYQNDDFRIYPVIPEEESNLARLENDGGVSQIRDWSSDQILGSYANIYIPSQTADERAWEEV